MPSNDQWPPAHGLPDKSRFPDPTGLKWGETPFDNLSRGELLRLVQAYHMASLSASGVMHQFRYGNEAHPYWGESGTGGRAWSRIEHVLNLAGDGNFDADSENIYRCFFRYAGYLLFRDDGGDQWGIADATGEMTAPYYPGRTIDGDPMRPLEWHDLLPKINEEDVEQ